MTRACRHLLCLCLAAATATCKKQPPAAPLPTAAPQPAQELRPPAEVRTQASTLTTELRVEYALNRLGADTVYLRSYNGGLVGPTLRLRPGDTPAGAHPAAGRGAALAPHPWRRAGVDPPGDRAGG